MNNLKIALVHDWLPVIGGAEKVLEAIYEVFPGPIHTLIHNEEKFSESILKDAAIKTSFIQRMPFCPKRYRSFLPLFPTAIEQFDLSEYDVVISSSYAVAKGALTTSNQLHICYCHSPIRYAWDLYHHYFQEANLTSGLKAFIAKLILNYIRIWDVSSTNRVDHFIANSAYIARRIKKIYNREATVIHPPVDVNSFELETSKSDFYVTASRLVAYKKIGLVVEAFNQMPHKKLVVIGEGPEYKAISKIAGPNITLLGYQSFEVLKKHLQMAKAFVFAGEEDFGITLVEAQACGTPVLAFGKGGAQETVIDGVTGLFFQKQTTDSILKCVQRFERMQDVFDSYLIRNNAERFSKEIFKSKMKSYVEEKYASFYQEQFVLQE